MRTSIIGALAFGWITFGCSGSTIRYCDVTDVQEDNGHQLSYSAEIPSDCPVPLGTIGEQKEIGANVYDGGNHDYAFAEVHVDNNSGARVGDDIEIFSLDNQARWRAQPKASFAAATAYSGSITNGVELPDAARNKGLFILKLNNSTVGATAKLWVKYVGSTMVASIGGPVVPLAGASATWSASTSGGTSPYSYAWYRNGSLVSTSSSYYSSDVGSTEFGLRVVVTDNVSASRWTDYWVDVDGVRATASGPTLIYYTNGAATWTASVTGGYSSYSIAWYLDDLNGTISSVGSGSSINLYPNTAGNWRIYAVVTDSHGTMATSTSVYFTAIGDANSECNPIPPALTCDP